MEDGFVCSSCGNRSKVIAYAVVVCPVTAFNRIFLFCSRECYRVPFHKALDGLSVEQRLGLQNVTIWAWDEEGKIGSTLPDLEHMLQFFAQAKAVYKEQAGELADDVSIIQLEGEEDDPVLDGYARRLRRALASTIPESSYPQNFKALFLALRGPAPTGPEKL